MNGATDHDGLDTRKVAGEAKRRAHRKRTAGATRLRKIHAKSRERQDAWREGGQPNRVAGLSRNLDDEYTQLRADRVGALPPRTSEAPAGNQGFAKTDVVSSDGAHTA